MAVGVVRSSLYVGRRHLSQSRRVNISDSARIQISKVPKSPPLQSTPCLNSRSGSYDSATTKHPPSSWLESSGTDEMRCLQQKRQSESLPESECEESGSNPETATDTDPNPPQHTGAALMQACSGRTSPRQNGSRLACLSNAMHSTALTPSKGVIASMLCMSA